MSDIDFGICDESDVESWKDEPISKVYSKLKGSVFHCTSIDNYRGIRNSGAISPNKGQFPYNHCHSKTYLGGIKGYVCLFDFTTVPDWKAVWNHRTWNYFFFYHRPVTVILQLNYEYIADKYIPSESAPPITKIPYIAYVEAWYPEPLPFEAVEKIIISKDRGSNQPPIFLEYPIEKITIFERDIDRISGKTQ